MLVIGLTGSIAMGKSEAARILADYGLPVFDADAEVHKLYDSLQGADMIRPFVPEAVLDNRVNREIVTKAVVTDRNLLSKLESAVHAEIKKRREKFIVAARAGGARGVVLDIPLLFETSAQKDVDKIIVISTSATKQKERVLARPKMTEERLALILARQMPDQEKRVLADAVIENNGSITELKTKLIDLMQKWGI